MNQSWLQRAEIASAPLPNGKRLFQAYAALLNFVRQNDWTGACHDSSASLYMILSEMGFAPKLVTGEVKAEAGIFDHSWVEVDGKVFDVAVGFPGEDGHHVGPSVFASLNLDTGEPTELKFGVRSPNGLDPIGQFVASSNLEQYSAAQPEGMTIWDLTPHIGAECGVKMRKADLRRKYGKLTRVLRGQADAN
ncbi:lasso peptide biosynthesis protein [Pseudomonas sp. NPDC087639]|uniref:lasso peptide biosynthesis protein n=1 Tax=Pseudomonas sp. NPDC087639 TaxID=3364445 RepID=UPI003825A970